MNPGRFLEMHSLRVEEYSLFKESGADYWHCSIIDAAGSTISGGFGFNKEMARKIAYAECLERFAYREIVKCGEREQERWGINLIPTACGFAAGFNEANTVIRSLSEAVERWVASKWIDDGYALTEIAEKDLVANLDPASAWFCKQFDEVLFFFQRCYADVCQPNV